jgi:hypothetical protein
MLLISESKILILIRKLKILVIYYFLESQQADSGKDLNRQEYPTTSSAVNERQWSCRWCGVQNDIQTKFHKIDKERKELRLTMSLLLFEELSLQDRQYGVSAVLDGRWRCLQFDSSCSDIHLKSALHVMLPESEPGYLGL